ncbi:MAG: DNA replication and repair protein RecF [Candidatus Peregrinibacteria bacterium Greene0416_19]|nr:MAG: DNA replication and repair protein RecF [Candidatus Peregrinibacteria bacterium Greene0416_19]
MRLLSLHLEQFRNYRQESLDLTGADLHLFAGRNGGGKTNLLEAVSVLSLSKSVLGHEEDDLRQWGREFYRVRGTAETDAGETKTLEVVSQAAPRREKACFLNDVRMSVADLVGTLPTATFLPQDLELFRGAPAERRRFIDQILCQVLPSCFRALLDYQRVLKQRNALLKQVATGAAGETALAPWDQELARIGAAVTVARLELVGTFNLSLIEELRRLGEPWQEAFLRYERHGTETDETALERELTALLEHHRSRDILLQSTTVGPHRDDWFLEIDGHNLATFASRGQQRIAVLALLFLETSYLQIRRGERPVILLDDILSELDVAHQESVLQSFSDYQILMTATQVLPEVPGAMVWTVEEGQVVQSRHGRSAIPA